MPGEGRGRGRAGRGRPWGGVGGLPRASATLSAPVPTKAPPPRAAHALPASPGPLCRFLSAEPLSAQNHRSVLSRPHRRLGPGARGCCWVGREPARSRRARLGAITGRARGRRPGRAGARTPTKNSQGDWCACGRCWREEGKSGSQPSPTVAWPVEVLALALRSLEGGGECYVHPEG